MLAAETVANLPLPGGPGRAGGAGVPAPGAEGTSFAAFAGRGQVSAFPRGLSARGGEQAIRVGMPGLFEQAFGRTCLHRLAAVEHEDPIAHRSHYAKIVGDPEETEGALRLDAADEFKEIRLDAGIQGRGGLVQDQQLGIAAQGHGEADPLPLATRKLVGKPFEERSVRREPQALQQGHESGERRGFAFLPVDARQQRKLLGHRHKRVERLKRILRHPRQARATDLIPGESGLPHRHPKGFDPSPRLTHSPGKHAEDRLNQEAFPRPGFPHQADPIPRGQIQVQRPQKMGPILALKAQFSDLEGHGSSLSEAGAVQHFHISPPNVLTHGNPGLGWTHLAGERDFVYPGPRTTIRAPRAPQKEVPWIFCALIFKSA